MSLKTLKFGTCILLTFLSLLFTFSCTRKPAENKIRIGVLRHESTLPIFVADKLNLFNKYQVNVELIEVPPGDHMPALISDRVEILSPTSFTVLFGVMSKNPELLYAVFPGAEVENGQTVYGFITSNDFKGSSIYDLRDKTVIAINPYTSVNIKTILTFAGMANDEWPEIRVANREAALNAISSGSADAAIMDQPALAVALSSGEYRLLVSNPRAKYIGSPYWSGSGAVKREVWNKRKNEFTKMMQAIDESLVYIRQNPNEAHKILAKKLELDENVADQMGGYFFPRSVEDVNKADISNTISALYKAKLLDKLISTDNFFPSKIYGEK